jgi:large subunit ribosomal protein L25
MPVRRSKEQHPMALTRNTLTARMRDGAGKGSARRLRAQGLVPAVVYGRHLEAPVHIAVDPIEVKKAIATPHRLNTLLSLELDGQPERLVLLKDYQQDPVTREMLHADFIDVRENEQVKVNVPLVLVGKPVGVTEGGILSQSRRNLEVLALPSAIPEKIEADVSALKIAQSLHINDVKLPAGVRVKTQVNYTLAVVSVPEKEEVAPAPAAAVAAVAGAPAAPGAPGAAPAAGDAKAAEGKGAAAPAAAEAKAAAGAKKDEKKK